MRKNLKLNGTCPPCKDCGERWVSEDGANCHSTCPMYLAYKERADGSKEARAKAVEDDGIYWRFYMDAPKRQRSYNAIKCKER